MGQKVSQLSSLTIDYSPVYSGANQRKPQNFASLVFVWVIHRWPVNYPHKWPVTRKMFPFDDIMFANHACYALAGKALYRLQSRKPTWLYVSFIVSFNIFEI